MDFTLGRRCTQWREAIRCFIQEESSSRAKVFISEARAGAELASAQA